MELVEYDERACREKCGRISWLTLISSQLIYLIVIVHLCQLNDALLPLRESNPQLGRLRWEW
jgi:hypothetical protein